MCEREISLKQSKAKQTRQLYYWLHNCLIKLLSLIIMRAIELLYRLSVEQEKKINKLCWGADPLYVSLSLSLPPSLLSPSLPHSLFLSSANEIHCCRLVICRSGARLIWAAITIWIEGYSVAHEYEQMANINLLHEVHLLSLYYGTIDPSKMNSNARESI